MWDTYRDRKNFLSDDNSLRHRHSILSSWNIWSEVVRKDHFYTHYRESTPVKYPHHCHLSSSYITQTTVSFKNQEQTFSQMYIPVTHVVAAYIPTHVFEHPTKSSVLANLPSQCERDTLLPRRQRFPKKGMRRSPLDPFTVQMERSWLLDPYWYSEIYKPEGYTCKDGDPKWN